jgi:hypothetical protein
MSAFRDCQYETRRWRVSSSSLGVKYPRWLAMNPFLSCRARSCISEKWTARDVTVRAPEVISSGNTAWPCGKWES